MPDPSLLSLAGAGVYCLVVIACVAAFLAGRKAPTPDRAIWAALAVLFVCLIVMRVLDLENIIRAQFRELLFASDSYGSRRGLQAVLTLVLLATVAGAAFALYKFASLRTRSRRARAVVVGAVVGGLMTGLVGVRLISHHATDAILFNPLRINWILDIGLAAAVLLAAGYYVQRSRARR